METSAVSGMVDAQWHYDSKLGEPQKGQWPSERRPSGAGRPSGRLEHAGTLAANGREAADMADLTVRKAARTSTVVSEGS